MLPKFILLPCGLICAAFSTTIYAQDAQAKASEGNSKAVSERQTKTAKLLTQYDSNRNGKFDADEIERIGKDRLLRWDKNRDGKVDQVELKTLRAASREMKKAEKKGDPVQATPAKDQKKEVSGDKSKASEQK